MNDEKKDARVQGVKGSRGRVSEDSNAVEAAVAPFRLGALQDYLTIRRHLESRGITPEMLAAWLADKTRRVKAATRQQREENRKRAEAWKARGPRCPDCNTVLTLRAGDDNDSHLTCPACRWGKYMPKPAQEVIQGIMMSDE